MKRLTFISILLVLLIVPLASCNLDFSSDMEGLSDEIFDNLVDQAGPAFKEDTSSDIDYSPELTPPATDTSTPDTPIDPPIDNPDDPVDPPIDDPDDPVDPPIDEPEDPVDPPIDEPDDPVDPPIDEPDDPVDPPIDDPEDPVDPPIDEPEDPVDPPIDEPEGPKYPELVIYQRTDFPINKYVGITVNEETHHNAPAYGYARLLHTLASAQDAVEFGYFTLQGMEYAVVIDFELAKLTLEKEDPYSDKYTFAEISKKIYEFTNKFGKDPFYGLKNIEVGSEPDVNISAEDYAKFLNYCYDGNEHTLGEEYGVATINPEIKLITGQMSTLNVDYIKALMIALDGSRSDEFSPIGGWSFKYMPNENGTSLNPESAYLNSEKLNELISYRDENYNNIEIYLSSFGWDTVNAESDIYVSEQDGFTSEELQGAYILRAFMIFDKMGIDKPSLDIIQDSDSEGHGIITKDGTYKISYNMLKSFKKSLGSVYFKEAIVNGENSVYVYRFENLDQNSVYAMWTDGGTASYQIEGAKKISCYDKSTLSYTAFTETEEDTFELSQMPIFVTDSDCVHSRRAINAVKPTCTRVGYTEGQKCSICNEVLIAREEIPALGHTEVVDPAIEPTCTRPGRTEGTKCATCNTVFTAGEIIPALGHKEAPIPAVDPTCTESGLTEGVICTACGYTLAPGEVIPALGHTEEIVPAVDPTCTESGLTEGKICTVCGETIIAQEEIPPTGHKFENYVEVSAPSCEADGKEVAICENGCGTEDERLVSGHLFVTYEEIAPSTCIEHGTAIAYCEYGCGATNEQSLPFADHIFDGRTCTICGAKDISQGLKYTISDDGQYYIVSGMGTCEDADVVIPSTYDGLPVTRIENYAFAYKDSITSIVIPDSVTVIETCAFTNCTSLKSVKLSKSLTTINSFAFSYCSSLESIIIPISATTIEFYTFLDCTSLSIYCEATEKPDGWDSSWNSSNCSVEWGYIAE